MEQKEKPTCFICGCETVTRFIEGNDGKTIYFCDCLSEKPDYDEDRFIDKLSIYNLELGIYDYDNDTLTEEIKELQADIEVSLSFVKEKRQKITELVAEHFKEQGVPILFTVDETGIVHSE